MNYCKKHTTLKNVSFVVFSVTYEGGESRVWDGEWYKMRLR